MDDFVITESSATWIEDRPVEIVERKGRGHPDSLCDGIAESISRSYTRWCQENLDTHLHHNFDKVQLVAGEVDVGFGGGHFLKPVRIQIAGRATRRTPDGKPIPVDLIAIQAAKEHIRQTMNHLDPDRHCLVDCFAGPGAGELAHLVEEATANDTSVGVAHWPLSQLEQLVYKTSEHLNQELRDRYPIGEDVKVMGYRRDDQMRLTCAVAFLAQELPSAEHYRQAKTAVREAVADRAEDLIGHSVGVEINTADDGSDGDAYLTLTGTSAEGGDDGATGRGNRVIGLITPMRPASMEAAAGKNPVSHVGKLYNVLALRAAQAIVVGLRDVRQAEVMLLSQIGRSLKNPMVATANLSLKEGELTPGLRDDVVQIMQQQLNNVDDVRRAIMQGVTGLY